MKSSEARYRELFERNPLPAWIYSTQTLQFLDVNQTAIDRYGYSFDQFMQMRISDIRMPEEHEAVERALSGGGSQIRSGPWQHRLSSGAKIIVELTSHDIDWLAVPSRLVMVHDITERVTSERKFRSLFEGSGDAILLLSEKAVIDCNAAAVKILGAACKQDLLDRNPAEFLAPVQPGGRTSYQLDQDLRETAGRLGQAREDCLQRRLDGEEFMTAVSATTIEVNGRPMIMASFHDLTERRKVEAAVRESEARLREAQEISRLGNWEVNLLTGVWQWCDQTYAIFDREHRDGPLFPEEFIASLHPDDRETVSLAASSCVQLGTAFDVEYRFIRASGDVRYIHSRAQRHVDDRGVVTRMSGTIFDTTEQRLANENLRASERRFEAFVENSPALAFIKDQDGRMVYMNHICRKMWNFDNIDWRDKTDGELWSPELAREFRKLDSQVLADNTSASNIDVVPLPDGSICKLLSYKFPLQLRDGERVVGGISLDITEQVDAEDRAVQALADKEVLLKEVHHRVKNNLQVICSLLGMQAAALNDPKSANALRDSQDRVQSMAMIHEMLYGSEMLADLDFSEYAERLLGELSTSHGLGGSRVRLRTDVSPLRISVDRAIPCGLILNELISNAMKYAFPDEREGEILISLTPCGAEHAVLGVADNGVGLPDGFALQNTRSLGLRIVNILARQLDGELLVHSHPGTRFEVRFPSRYAA